MSDFDLFHTIPTVEDKVFQDDNYPSCACIHPNTVNEGNVLLCEDCGEEMEKSSEYDTGLKYFGSCDTRHSSDPGRCQPRKIEDRSIFGDVSNMGFSDKIISIANGIYIEVTKGDGNKQKIYRGNTRKAIIFACIFHAYKISGNPRSWETLIRTFGLNRKDGLKGLKHVNLKVPKDSPVRTTYITPINLINEIMSEFQATKEQKDEVNALYRKIENKSSKINRSRPQSIASGLVYYWICKNGKNVTIREFSKKIYLSELTINKIYKEICTLLDKHRLTSSM